MLSQLIEDMICITVRTYLHLATLFPDMDHVMFYLQQLAKLGIITSYFSL